jgi:Protein of unknown function (DUF3102)
VAARHGAGSRRREHVDETRKDTFGKGVPSKPNQNLPQAVAAATSDEWARRIKGAWAAGVAAFVETGRELIEAKRALGPGAFMHMIETELPFSDRTAERLMAIARHPVLSDSTHASNLPPSWTTLYELSRLPAGKLRKLIEQERVYSDMERGDATSLVLEAQPDPSSIPAHEVRQASAALDGHTASSEGEGFRQLATMPETKSGADDVADVEPEPEPTPERGAVVAACVGEVETVVSAAVAKLAPHERLGLFEELERALQALFAEPIHNRWRES